MNDEVAGGKWTEQGKPCPVCNERFYDKQKLRQHRAKMHPVACPQCGKAFVTADGVRLHEVSVHGLSLEVASAPPNEPPS